MPVIQDDLSTVFSALADPTRRAILERLAEGDATVLQLAEPFERDPMTAPEARRVGRARPDSAAESDH